MGRGEGRRGDGWRADVRHGRPRRGDARHRRGPRPRDPRKGRPRCGASRALDGDRRRRARRAGRRQQRERVLVAEPVGLAPDADVQAAVAGGDDADRRAGPNRRSGADRHGRQREVAHAAAAALHAHDAALTGDRPGVYHRPAARGADRGARTGGEVGAAVCAARERRVARVREGARHLAWNRPQPSLSQGGGGNRQRHKDRDQEGYGRDRDGKSGRGRGGAHERNVRWGRGVRPGCALDRCGVGAESLRMRVVRARCAMRTRRARAPAALYTGIEGTVPAVWKRSSGEGSRSRDVGGPWTTSHSGAAHRLVRRCTEMPWTTSQPRLARGLVRRYACAPRTRRLTRTLPLDAAVDGHQRRVNRYPRMTRTASRGDRSRPRDRRVCALPRPATRARPPECAA